MKFQNATILYVSFGLIATVTIIAIGFKAYGFKKKSHQIIDPNKNSFPELKGTDLDYAVQYLKTNYPHLKCFPLKHGSARILNLSGERVWLDYDSNNKISIVPRIG